MNWKDRLEEEGKEIPLIQYKKEICAQAARLRRFTGRKKSTVLYNVPGR